MKQSRTKAGAVIAAIVTALGVVCVAPYGSATAQADTPTGTQIVFRDDFSGTALSTSWFANSAEIGSAHGYPGGPWNFGTDEIEEVTNKPANVGVKDGNLYISPQRDTAGNWTSARIETNKSDFKAPAGGVMHVEARLQMPNVSGAEAQGYWPAFWMLGGPYRQDRWSWPRIGEFDIMEQVNGINKNWSTLHCGVWAGGPCGETDGISNKGVAPTNGVAFPGNFHVYAFEWDRSLGDGHEQFRWYNDGVLAHIVKQDTPPAGVAPDVWATVWTDITQHQGYFIILNVAIGGQFPAHQGGGPSAATKPGVPMLVDYVQVDYRGGTTNPSTTTSTTTSSSTSSSPTTSTANTTSASPTTSTTAPSTSNPSTTSPTTVSGAPSNLNLQQQSTSSAKLTWSGPANATYEILRGEAGDRIATTTGNTFTDNGLNLNTPYVYSVRGSGTTTPQRTITLSSTPSTTSASPTTSTTTTTTVPPTTTVNGTLGNLQGTSTNHSVTLTWSGSSGVTYEILRGESGDRIATVTGTTTFTDRLLNPNTPYVYSVRSGGVTTKQITIRTTQ